MAVKLTFRQILTACLVHIREKNLLPKFQSLKNNDDRVKYCLEDPFLEGSLSLWIRQTCLNSLLLGFGKDSAGLREEGNVHFRKQDYVKSVVLYTASVRDARGKEQESLALANRSAALFKLGAFNDCLKDINLALAAGYPERLQFKVMLRRAHCLFELERYEDFEETLKDLAKFTEIGIVTEVQKLKKMEKKPQRERKELVEKPGLYRGENENVSNVSAALEVQRSKEKGRFYVAKEKIAVGDFLVVETPYVVVLSEDFHETHCHFCIRRLTLEKCVCTKCAKAWFCNEVCRDSALEQFHKFECSLLPALNPIQLPHVGLRVVLVAGVEKILSGKADERYQRVFGFINHVDEMDPVELVQHSLGAALLTMLVTTSEVLFSEEPPQEVKYKIGGIILHHVLQVYFNAHTISIDVAKPGNRPTLSPSQMSLSSFLQMIPLQQVEPLAVALYPAASNLNHWCDPTVVHTFYNGALLVMRSLKEVEPGEEVTTSYGPHFRCKGRTDRLTSLKSRYLFTCQCPHCTNTEVEFYFEILDSFKCCECGGPLRRVFPDQTTSCRKCNKAQTVTNQVKMSIQADDFEREASRLTDKGDEELARYYLTRCVMQRREALYKGHLRLAVSAGCLAVSLVETGKFEESLEYLQLSLESYEEHFGRYSHEFAVLTDKLTDRYFETFGASTPPKNVYEKLEGILKEAAFVLTFYEEPGSESFIQVNRKLAQVALKLGEKN